MRIAIASGKGGTGKTTIATSLALSLASEYETWYLDCDVEAPNGHLFLHPNFADQVPAVIKIPRIQSDICTLCGNCVDVCQFHALANIVKSIMVFPQLCHGCGSCTLNCPQQAIQEVDAPIGKLESGIAMAGIHFQHGMLSISEPMPTPVIRQLKRRVDPGKNVVVILDSPPGASCSVVETLRGVDYVLLVTEPTPFGIHDLYQMLGIVHDMNIPAGMIINRDGIGEKSMQSQFAEIPLPVLLRVPFDRRIASGIAAGKTLIEIDPKYQQVFSNLYQQIEYQLKVGNIC